MLNWLKSVLVEESPVTVDSLLEESSELLLSDNTEDNAKGKLMRDNLGKVSDAKGVHQPPNVL
jgi:hypothetical protein